MHVYTLFEFILLALYYKSVLQGSWIQRFVHPAIVFFAVLCVINALFFQNFFTYNTHTKSIEALFVIVMGIVCFKRELDSVAAGNKRNAALTYINAGLLIYFSGSFIWFTIYNLTWRDEKLGLIMWTVHATLLLTMYMLIAIALWKYKRPETTSTT